ncbi:hypothetical protein HDU92_000820 [Lobulomyces angularis]|nr:hypothetical protein HDU92_000820 [Lobulomyces angularis]
MGNDLSLDTRMERASKTGVLTLSGVKLKNFDSLQSFQLSLLKSLDISDNKLEKFDSIMKKWVNLKLLNASQNKFVDFTLICELPKLENLNVACNKITSIPPQINYLANLKQLNVSNNEILLIPKELGLLPNLVTIDLSKNKIKVIPQEVGNLSSLEEMNFESNLISIVPVELSNLTKIKTFNFNNNDIKTIPKEIYLYTNCIGMELENNPVTRDELSEIPGYEKYISRRKQRVDQFLK